MKTLKNPKIVPDLLIGKRPTLEFSDEAERDAKTDEIAERYDLEKGLKVLVEKEEDITEIDVGGADGFVILPHCSERFSPLIYLAESGMPVIIASEENTFDHALETYEYLADRENVEVAFGPEAVRRKIRALRALKWIREAKTCLFDLGEWRLSEVAWHKNPVVSGMLDTQSIDREGFFDLYENADRAQAESLARGWIEESEVVEPSFEDVVKSARLYMAMKTVMEEMDTDAGYVMWCGQFTERLGTKMCFALAKLADDGYPMGCWRGENLLPLLMLHSASGRPVFVCEAFTHLGKTMTLRHCFAPSTIASCRYVLRRWRDREGTVTGYCQLPEGEVTVVNCGIGDRLAVFKGRVTECRDLGGENCRMTVWVEVDDERSIHKMVGRECTMVYGDYEEEARAIGEMLGLKVQ